MADEISSSDDTIDSRNAEERIDELEDERQGLEDAILDAQAEDSETTDGKLAIKAAKDELKDWDDSSESDELEFLKELKDETENYGWADGIIFINWHQL